LRGARNQIYMRRSNLIVYHHCKELGIKFICDEGISMDKKWYIYILANNKDWVLYIWVTSNLPRRIYEHKNKIYAWFSSKYNCNELVYYEECSSITDAITREKQLKWWNRKKKIELIEQNNPNRIDLAKDR